MAAPQVPDGGDGGGHFSLLLLSVVVFLFNKLVFYDKFFLRIMVCFSLCFFSARVKMEWKIV